MAYATKNKFSDNLKKNFKRVSRSRLIVIRLDAR